MKSSSQLETVRVRRLREMMSIHVQHGAVAGLVALVAEGTDVDVVTLGVQDLKSKRPMRRNTIFRIASMTKPITAAGAMLLVERGVLGLDDPVERWLPELSNRSVLRSLDSELGDVVPATRPISVRDLLTMRMGFGLIWPPTNQKPIQRAISRAGLQPGANPPGMSADEWIGRLGDLPLMHQPSERWMYHTSSDVLSVLIARAAKVSFGEFLSEHIFRPLQMWDTAYWVSDDRLDRLASAYRPGEVGSLVCADDSDNGAYSSAPLFECGGTGLVSTVDDYLKFARVLVSKGQYGGGRLMSPDSVHAMLSNQLKWETKVRSPFYPGFWENGSWGLGLAVNVRNRGRELGRGGFGWDGGLGTSWYSDPSSNITGVLMTQTSWTSPKPPQICEDFWRALHPKLDLVQSTHRAVDCAD